MDSLGDREEFQAPDLQSLPTLNISRRTYASRDMFDSITIIQGIIRKCLSASSMAFSFSGGHCGTLLPSVFALLQHSHSSSLNAFCIIPMRRRPGGRSESLWSSCSTASTASGYHFVIRVITGGWLLWRFVLSRRDIILQRPRCSKRQLQAADLVPQGRAVCLVGHGSCLVGKMPYE